ncbi:hypothetical protein JNUCC1_00840 [Lentibacillus sp. JNUCC-1]|uniref:hypothetical protein n=1 Tax=Lentibacillus sp. JNUCC-1 TaxID=2654513 RepID=UPI0012E93342|nr:hypothetical protein [Lentibacillus sp. JNUCC-1]MUV37034.1 hypothetical protein [Lentibacillus sp. JNUCC-1]
MTNQPKKDITLIGRNQLITEDQLYSYMYKSLKWTDRLKKEMTSDFIKKHTCKRELIYHPIWLIKTLVIADRKPFPPKKMPKMIFVDAVSGYRGLITKVPETTKQPIPAPNIITPDIDQTDIVKDYVHDVQKKQINRAYVLKKPDHKIIDSSLVYLPLWFVSVASGEFSKQFVLNANTGESEAFMSQLWTSGEWLNVAK